MKNILLGLVLIITFNTLSQDYPENEVKFNILNTMVVASFEFGYERFVDRNQSIDFEFLANDRFNYQSQKTNGRNFKTNAIKLGYNYYFGEGNGNGVYANPFFKYRFGEFVENEKPNVNMNSFIIGIGVGYKWNSGDKFVFGPYGTLGRNFGKDSTERFQGIDFNAGISVGYRF